MKHTTYSQHLNVKSNVRCETEGKVLLFLGLDNFAIICKLGSMLQHTHSIVFCVGRQETKKNILENWRKGEWEYYGSTVYIFRVYFSISEIFLGK